MLRQSMRHARCRFVVPAGAAHTIVPTTSLQPSTTRLVSNIMIDIYPRSVTACRTKLSRCFSSSQDRSYIMSDDPSLQSSSSVSPAMRGATTSSTKQQPPTSSRLGSLTEQGWDDALTTLFRHVEKAQESPEGAMYWMNKADKLLGRLQAEYATKSTASRTRGDDLLDGQLQILQGWSGLGRENPSLRLAGERGTILFWNIIERSKKPWWNTEAADNTRRLVLAHSFLDLLEAFARRDYLSDKELSQSTRLLLWKDLPAMEFDPSDMGPMYGVLTQQVELAQDEKSLALLNAQWKRICDEDISKWYLQVENENVTNEPSLHANDTKAKSDTKFNRSLSSFESERMWLSQLDLSNPDDVPKGLNQLIISLAQNDDPSAIWRAEEILRKLESGGGGNSLDSAAYAAMAERWLKTNESQAHRRVMELCFRPDKFDAKLVSVLLRGLRREKDVSAEMVNQLLEWFTSQKRSISQESRHDLLEGFLFVLRRHGNNWQGWELFRSEMENGLVVDERLCELAVASLPGSAQPDQVIEVYEFLQSKDVKLDIGFFLEATKRLADLREKERLHHLTFLTKAVLNRLSTGTIDEKNPTLAFFFRSIFELVNHWKQDVVAFEIIELAESSKSVKLPIFCYTSTARTLSWKGNLRGVRSIYHKLRTLYKAGHENLHPDADFYLSYMRALSTESTTNSSKLSSVFEEQLSLLEELKARYKATSDAQYKPSPGIFKTLLSTLTQIKPTEESANKAEWLLNEMISLEAFDSEDADPFTMTMHVILQSPRTDEYESIDKIRDKMNDCKIKNSELVFVNTLRACTRTQGAKQREDALERTLAAVADFRRHVKGDFSPNGARIYSLALASLFRNVKEHDTRLYPIVRQVFQFCCQDGYVTPQIVNQLQGGKNISRSFQRKLYGEHLLYGDREPPEWSRNIRSEVDRQ
eukprot:scaffold1181_cov152-Amphora_coffeaeformis.AAC.11